MGTYQISNRVSGHVFGAYEAESATEAIRAMHQDAGYEDGEWPPGSNDDLVVAEVEAKPVVTTSESVTAEQVELLRAEALAAGDYEQVDVCDRALCGDAVSRTICAEVIARTEAMPF